MITVYVAKAFKATETKKGTRFDWYETPMFFKKGDALSQVNWYINHNKKYEFGYITEKTIF